MGGALPIKFRWPILRDKVSRYNLADTVTVSLVKGDGHLGMRLIQNDENFLEVSHIVQKGPLFNVLHIGDEIIKFNNKKVLGWTVKEFWALEGNTKPGDKIKILVYRGRPEGSTLREDDSSEEGPAPAVQHAASSRGPADNATPAVSPVPHHAASAILPTSAVQRAASAILSAVQRSASAIVPSPVPQNGASVVDPAENQNGASVVDPAENQCGASAVDPEEYQNGASAVDPEENENGASAVDPEEYLSGASASKRSVIISHADRVEISHAAHVIISHAARVEILHADSIEIAHADHVVLPQRARGKKVKKISWMGRFVKFVDEAIADLSDCCSAPGLLWCLL
ncbi:uncharacterized protein LOC134948219 isoform X2 [Pseudophryne corroboree]|uniref:uncharacterized protein LOC134948219 isoform X2 n=1 Tax=Pseudophryne corroboree TaxID=495146 RepID=UPI0030819660